MSVPPVRWGVLGVAKIANEKILPPLRTSPLIEVAAIASRDLARAGKRRHGYRSSNPFPLRVTQ